MRKSLEKERTTQTTLNRNSSVLLKTTKEQNIRSQTEHEPNRASVLAGITEKWITFLKYMYLD